MKRSVWGGVTPKITRAAGAVVLGLALTATPVFAIAAEQPAAKTEAAATAAATEQAATTAAATPVADNGAANAAEAAPKAGAAQATSNDNLHTYLQDQSVTEITLAAAGTWNPKPWYLPAAGHLERVTVDRDLTINGYSAETGKSDNYLNDTVFTVTAGHTLTLNNVNIYNDPGAAGTALTSVTVQQGGKLITKGTGDIVSNNGINGDAIAIKLEDGAKAELGAATSGFSWGFGQYKEYAQGNYAGNYGSSFAVWAGDNTDLKITNGTFVEENGRGEAITSSGRVTIDPAENAPYYSPSLDGDLVSSNLGTVHVFGQNAVLVAKHTQFGPNEGHGDRENTGVNANVTVTGGASAYLTDCASTSVDLAGAADHVYAISVDASSNVFSQDTTYEEYQTYSTDNDFPGFGGFQSVFEGDYLKQNQYYAETTNESLTNTVDGTTQLLKVDDGQEFGDLETQVKAKATDLNAKVTPIWDDFQDGYTTGTVKASLGLGKSNVYGKYEIAKNESTGINGEGHVYEVSPVHELQAGWDVSAYRSGDTFTAPKSGDTNVNVNEKVPDGLVFAGWYTKGGDLDLRSGASKNGYNTTVPGLSNILTSSDPASNYELPATQKDGYAYAKFVPAALLSVKAQSTAVDANNQYAARFMFAKDSYNYNGADFKIDLTDASGNATGESVTSHQTTNWDYLLENNNKVYAKDVFKTDIPLLFTRAYLNKIPASYDGGFNVTPSWTTPDGTVVTGATQNFTAAALKDAAPKTNN